MQNNGRGNKRGQRIEIKVIGGSNNAQSLDDIIPRQVCNKGSQDAQIEQITQHCEVS